MSSGVPSRPTGGTAFSAPGRTSRRVKVEGPAYDWPLALVTTTSENHGDEALVRVALEALADHPRTIIVTVPRQLLRLSCGPRARDLSSSMTWR